MVLNHGKTLPMTRPSDNIRASSEKKRIDSTPKVTANRHVLPTKHDNFDKESKIQIAIEPKMISKNYENLIHALRFSNQSVFIFLFLKLL